MSKEIKGVIEKLERDGVTYFVTDPQDYTKGTQVYMRVVFTGDNPKTVKLWQDKLKRLDGQGIEKFLILEYAKQNEWLMGILEERAGMMHDGCHDDPLSGSLLDVIGIYLEGRP